MIELDRQGIGNDYTEEVAVLSNQNAFACYQCGKCSAGCPLVDQMDILPHQILKLLQMGQQELIEEANTAFICATCFVCSTRCPKGVRITEIMEAIRVVKTRSNQDMSGLDQLGPSQLDTIPPIALVANQRKLGR